MFKAYILTYLLFTFKTASCDEAPTVIIIGAGASGIAAASQLLKSGINNLIILEAETRIGGRIHTVNFKDSVIDLGAEWCHGDAVYDLVKDFNVLKPAYPSLNYYSTHQNFNESVVQELYDLCVTIYGEEKLDEEISLGQYMVNRFNTTIREKFGTDEEELKLAWDIFKLFETEVLISKGASSWFDIAVKSDYEVWEGNRLFNWQSYGFKTVLEVLMGTFPDCKKKLPIDDKIVFRKQVTNIHWNDSKSKGRVMVKCLDDTEYFADHVILTVSLGVLKERFDTLFHPALPQEKINAINELGIASVMKIMLHFPEPWWLHDSSVNYLCWNEDDHKAVLKEFSEDPNYNERLWMEDLTMVLTSDVNPTILQFWLTGKTVPQVELLSNKIITNRLMYVLDKFMGQTYNVTTPDGILKSQWHSNPHFRGVYSFATLAAQKRDVSGAVALSQPLSLSSGKPLLLFAGEATNPTHFSTVHGAIETGYREAQRIIDFYK